MLATSNFVNQVHNGTVNNNPISDNINSENSSQMTTNKQTNFSSNSVDNSLGNNSNSKLLSENNENNEESNLTIDVNNGDSSQAGLEDPDDSVDITISNVVTNFSVQCHLNLRQIATNGSNVVYRRDQSIILMKLRQPRITASIWSSGKITCTGATTEESAKCASRKVARVLQKMGFRVRFSSYRVVNVLGACRLPFGIKIHEFSDVNRPLASYEPELHPGATYRIKELKAVLKVFQTGSITITAPNVRNVQLAVEHIYPLVYEYRKPKPNMGNNSHGISLHHEEDEKDALLYDKFYGDGRKGGADSEDDSD